MAEKLRAVIYTRVSDQSQIENNSLETQLKACKIFADNNNYEIVKLFREEGVSAKHIQTRPQMRSLLDFCSLKKNHIAAVIIYKMDRWSRNVEEGLLAQTLLAKSGVSILPVSETTEQSPMAKAMRTFLLTFGQLENELKGQRVRDNMKTMFHNGLWCWKPRMGYKRPYRTKEENKGKAMVVDERLGGIIRLIITKAAETTISKDSLAKYANTLGFKQAYGKEADGRLVARLVSDTFYYGYMYAPKWKEYAWGKHEALVDQNTWERAHRNVFGRGKKYNHQDNEEYPLKGLIECATCLGSMTSSNPKGRSKKYLYYECHKKSCGKRIRISAETAHTEFLSLLSSLKPSERVLEMFNQLVFAEWDQGIEKRKFEAEVLEKQIKSLEFRLVAIAESNAKGILSTEESQKTADEVRKEIAILGIERSDSRIEQYSTESVRNFVVNFLMNIDNLWQRITLPHRQALQAFIFPENIVAEKDKIRTTRLSNTFELIDALKKDENNLVTPVNLISNRFWLG